MHNVAAPEEKDGRNRWFRRGGVGTLAAGGYAVGAALALAIVFSGAFVTPSLNAQEINKLIGTMLVAAFGLLVVNFIVHMGVLRGLIAFGGIALVGAGSLYAVTSVLGIT